MLASALFCHAWAHAHETLLWASKNKSARHTFDYDLIDSPNPDAQVSSIWRISTVSRFDERFVGLAARRIAATGRGSLLREVSEQVWGGS